jgi:F0F1-type ATP synthase delta subunit
MNDKKKILTFIDSITEYYSDYVLNQLKKEQSIKLISKIMDQSNKEISEAALVLISAIKYTYKGDNPFLKLEETDSFQKYLEDNYNLILKICEEKRVQGNLPERALPILEVINCKTDIPIIFIELGASYGLIGQCLLYINEILENKERYFRNEQKIPEYKKSIDHYLGIEFDPPDKEWLLASVWKGDEEWRMKNFLKYIRIDKRFELIKGNAFGFSDLDAVKNFTRKPGKIVVLTSFMLYQFEEKKKKLLVDEILEFTRRVNGHWINQAVNISLDSKENEYFITWEGRKIIQLFNDTCLNWKWIE